MQQTSGDLRTRARGLLHPWVWLLLILFFASACSSAATSTSAPEPAVDVPVTPSSPPPTATPAATPTVAEPVAALPPEPPTPTIEPTATTPPEPEQLWIDVTESTIGETQNWTNKVELADINGDGLVDLLFANGGDYHRPGDPVFSQVFVNRGPGRPFEEVTTAVFGPEPMLVRVIKVRDINNDGFPDIFVGTHFGRQSRLYLGNGTGSYVDVTDTHLPQLEASIGDIEFGDVDGDRDLDVVLANWGLNSPMYNRGGRTMLWLNDGTGRFTDATATNLPDILVRFSWELEFVDIDNDYDLDVLVSCKQCDGSYLFENDGTGKFTDVSQGRLPQFENNYDFEAIDLNGDAYLDLVTSNDSTHLQDHLFLNNQQGEFEDATEILWPESENIADCDDNLMTFLDFDSDGDADLFIGSLNCPDRLLINDGLGGLKLHPFVLDDTPGTLGVAFADLNGDHKIDMVQGQGEVEGAFEEWVYFGDEIDPDTAPPKITLVERAAMPDTNQPIQIRARVHDNKSPTMPHDWQFVVLRWTADGETFETPMQWYGEYLWRGSIDPVPADSFSYHVCAADAAGNETCKAP